MKGLKIFIVLILIVAIAGVLIMSIGKRVSVAWSQQDFNTAIAKTKIKIPNIETISLDNLALGNFKTTGKVAINDSFTSAEVTSLIAMANDQSGPVKDVKVSLGANNTGEVGFKISKEFLDKLKDDDMFNQFLRGSQNTKPTTLEGLLGLLIRTAASAGNVKAPDLTKFTVDLLTGLAGGKPIYAAGSLSRVSGNKINIKITSIKLGQIPLPESAISAVEEGVINFINTLIAPENGFDIQELRVENGQLFYRGTLPAEISGTKVK